MKRTLTALLSVMLTVFLALSVSADRTLPLVVDNAGLLSAEDEAALNETLQSLADQLEVEIAIITVNSTGSKSTMEYADDFYDENGYGFGDNDNGVLLLIDMSEREWWITTHDECTYALDDYVLNSIESAFLDDLASGNYYSAFMTFALMCADSVEAYRSGEYVPVYGYDYDYDYNYESEPLTPVDYVIPSLIIGFVLSLITVSVMKSGMKTVRSESGAATYLLNGSLNLTSQSDHYLYSNVVRTPRSSNNTQSRSGGSTHRSSSGRSHGGRGGRF